MYIQNQLNEWGYTIEKPFVSDTNQFVLPQPIGDGNISPIISKETLYDNFSYSHRIVADVEKNVYGLDNWLYNYNNYNAFLDASGGNYLATNLYVSGAYGSKDVFGGALENLDISNLYLQFNYDSMFLPIDFIMNETYSQNFEMYRLFNNDSQDIGNLFMAFPILLDTDPLMSAYSPLSMISFSYRNNESTITYGSYFTEINVRINYLKTGVYTTDTDIQISSVDFIYNNPYSFISLPDILKEFYVNHFVSGSNGPVHQLYIDSMSLSVDFSKGNYEPNPIRCLMFDSIYYSRMYDPSEEVLFFGNQWYKALNGGAIGGRVDYNIDVSRWLVDSVGAFMDAELMPGFAIGGIFAVLIAFPIVVWFLKVVLGG